MDHSEAIRMGATEKYLLGELGEDEKTRFEEHFFDCADCAEDLKATDTFMANAQRVFSETRAAKVTPLPAPARRRGLPLFWPAPLGAVAASFLLLGVIGYQAVFQVPDLRKRLAQAEAPQAASWHFIPVSRGAAEVVKVPKGVRMVGLTLSRGSAKSFPYYQCEVQRAGGGTLLSSVVAAAPAGDELQILIPVFRLPSGDYTLVLGGQESSAGEVKEPDLVRYAFTLDRGEE